MCEALDCGKPPNIVESVPLFGRQWPTVYGSKPLTYACKEGKWFARNIAKITATCNSNGVWNVSGQVDANKWPSCVRESVLLFAIFAQRAKLYDTIYLSAHFTDYPSLYIMAEDFQTPAAM